MQQHQQLNHIIQILRHDFAREPPQTLPPQQSVAVVVVVRRTVPPRGLTTAKLHRYTEYETDAELRPQGICNEHIPRYEQNIQLIANF